VKRLPTTVAPILSVRALSGDCASVPHAESLPSVLMQHRLDASKGSMRHWAD